jgi:hypothetical protein
MGFSFVSTKPCPLTPEILRSGGFLALDDEE